MCIDMHVWLQSNMKSPRKWTLFHTYLYRWAKLCVTCDWLVSVAIDANLDDILTFEIIKWNEIKTGKLIVFQCFFKPYYYYLTDSTINHYLLFVTLLLMQHFKAEETKFNDKSMLFFHPKILFNFSSFILISNSAICHLKKESPCTNGTRQMAKNFKTSTIEHWSHNFIDKMHVVIANCEFTIFLFILFFSVSLINIYVLLCVCTWLFGWLVDF